MTSACATTTVAPTRDDFVKDPELTEELIADLDARGLLFRRSDYEHSYPHCWRCGTPLIYYAKPSWYIATSKVREQMMTANETVSWHPPHIKHGRFGDWLSNNVDWALSRERYWGTPLPVWRCPGGHTHTIGSFAELGERTGDDLDDHHRPYVDEVEFPCLQTGCEQPMRRVPEVIDVWFDSGRCRSPSTTLRFENEQVFRERFPADFICEALDQTRGWFYSLLAVSTLLFGEAPYKNVVCLGLILDGEGQKMSKSKGNTVEPWQVLDKYGADAFRWYFFTSKQPWDGYRFSEEAIGEGVRLFLKQLWSTYFFYVLYANANAQTLNGGSGLFGGGGAFDPTDTPASGEAADEARELRPTWIGGRCRGRRRPLNWWQSVSMTTTRRLRGARSRSSWTISPTGTCAVRAGASGMGDAAAFATLRECLLCVSKLLAPFCPFVADEIYDNLDGTLASVHLCDFPVGDALPARDTALDEAMAIARETVRLGLGARAQAKIKVRQPLEEAVVVADGRERAAIERLAEIVREELNVRRVRFVGAADELGRVRGEGQLPHAGAAVRQRHAARRRGDRGARPSEAGGCGASRRRGGDLRGRSRAHALRAGRDPDDEGTRGLQRRARGRARGGARPHDRREPAARGPLARDRSRRPECAQERWPGGRGPDRAGARRRPRTDRRCPRARTVCQRRDLGREPRLGRRGRNRNRNRNRFGLPRADRDRRPQPRDRPSRALRS